jgi:hypothetical protein
LVFFCHAEHLFFSFAYLTTLLFSSIYKKAIEDHVIEKNVYLMGKKRFQISWKKNHVGMKQGKNFVLTSG